MAKAVLPVDYKNDILAAAMNGSRRFKITDNGDGTITLEDVSTYDQVGSEFGAAQINATNQAVNESVDKDKILKTLEEVSASTDSDAVVGRGAVAELNQNMGGLTFAQDAEGKWGYKPSGADSVIPFSSKINVNEVITMSKGVWSTFDLSVPLEKLTGLIIMNESLSKNTAVLYFKPHSENKWNSGYGSAQHAFNSLDNGSVYGFDISDTQYKFYTANAGTYRVFYF